MSTNAMDNKHKMINARLLTYIVQEKIELLQQLRAHEGIGLTTFNLVHLCKAPHDGLWVGEATIKVQGAGVGSQVVDDGRMGMHYDRLTTSHLHTPVPHSL